VITVLPPPVACGAPPAFDQWRAGQPEAVCFVVDSPHRVNGLVLPTGAGKSLITATLATLTGWRTAILTSTKGLQDQILQSFHSIGLTDLRGQTAYRCRALDVGGIYQEYRTESNQCDQGPCKAGLMCPWRDLGCGYFDAIAQARRTKILVTNYQAWMHQAAVGDGLGVFDCLILDEAHAAPEEVGAFLTTQITVRQLAEVGLTAPGSEDAIVWQAWAGEHRKDLARKIDALTKLAKERRLSPGEMREVRQQKSTLRVIERLADARPDEWLVIEGASGYSFHPIEVAAHVEGALLKGIKKVVLTSATLTPKTAETLGLDPTTVGWHEQPSTFPVERRPVTHVATVRIDHRLDAMGARVWLMRLDQILGARADRKGIVHTGSYERAKLIYNHSEHHARLIFHERATTREMVAKFRAAGPGAVMVSPSLTTGFDFPGLACEYQVILKVPWPDSREPVIAARTVKDKSYPAYLAMQDLVQAVGRGMRSAEDRCETLILDDHVRWFLAKYRSFAPQWFLSSFRSAMTIPPPPPKLEQATGP
jgi:Rad3-related DNA helicase